MHAVYAGSPRRRRASRPPLRRSPARGPRGRGSARPPRARGRGIAHGPALVAEHLVQRVRQGVHLRGLPVACENEARPGVLVEVTGDSPRPLLVRTRSPRAPSVADRVGRGAMTEGHHRDEDRRRDPAHLARLGPQAIVSAHSGDRQPRLDDVEAADRVPGGGQLAPAGPRASPRHRRAAHRKEVGVERQDDLGRREVVAWLDHPPERQPRPAHAAARETGAS